MEIQALAVSSLYPAILADFSLQKDAKILDVPAGHGAFAHELLLRGYTDITCLDIHEAPFKLKDQTTFICHDVINPLPFPTAHFDCVFSIEGIEHFINPWQFVMELGRVLKPGGKLYISTPNTFSIDARFKYLISGYFPRFRPLMQSPEKVMEQDVDDAHISPIYFWQLHYFLMQMGIDIVNVSTNELLQKRKFFPRLLEQLFAKIIRSNIKKKNFPDKGVSTDAVLFGDLLILECIKQ
ncbi:class I SAM-dependent methyltransferase [Parvibium lacunae]|uniref:SAM-dependent methyltransferase n=1 Tax=Parvibium lacunae TaxID=1888893 RepID=A0A368L493_9BURK|nr:class I SAM-dependent methyltransferase [Parvibium lacunae]RCS58303.1 SAM-dependent methyltransferase [Parvibium lacunae]